MLIGLYGKARSGKTTVAKFLKDYYSFEEFSFAQPLKHLVRELFDMSPEQLESDELKEKIDLRYGMSPRKLLQYLGTNVFRELYPDIWVDYAIRRYKKIMAYPHADDMKYSPAIVISDVRFKNEKRAIEINNGVVWKIVREDHAGASSGIKGHPSEHDLDDVPDSEFAAVLRARSGDLEGLRNQAEKALNRFLEENS